MRKLFNEIFRDENEREFTPFEIVVTNICCVVFLIALYCVASLISSI